MKIIPGQIPVQDFHQYLLGSISPRPVCFASTIDGHGNSNLSPFSFFNAFGSHPPILIFSPARRVRNNTIKHTLENIYATMEVVINVVTYGIARQASLASCEFPRGVNEFEKAGLTPLPGEMVRPFRVKESPVNMECKVKQVIETGQEGGAGNLVICEMLLMHIDESILSEDGKIDPHKIDSVGRMGFDYYCRASGDAVFTLPQPKTHLGIGVDSLPLSIRNSDILTGNNLGQLANLPEMPLIDATFGDGQLTQIIQYYGNSPEEMEKELHRYARQLLEQDKVKEAWQVLLAGG